MSKIVKNVKHLAKKKTKKELEEELALKEQTMDILADADTTPIAVDTASLPHYALAETVAAGAAVATDAAVAGTTATVATTATAAATIPTWAYVAGGATLLGGVGAAAGGGSSSSTPVVPTTPTDTISPIFTSSSTATPIAENSGAGQVVYTAVATDNVAVTSYTLGGADAGLFTIDNTGRVTLTANPDFETKSSYSFTVTATDAAGNVSEKDIVLNINDVRESSIINGTSSDDVINYPNSLNYFTINSLSGNDTITTSGENDIIRAGEGLDTVNSGAGNDIIVVVGTTSANQYTQEDITNAGDTGIDLSSVVTLADLNGRVSSEIVSGESIDGGSGTNRLIIYGDVDLSGVNLANVTQIQVNSTLTLTAQQLNALPINLLFGDGESTLNITNSGTDPISVDLSGKNLSDFKTINIGQGVTLIADQSDIDSLHYIVGDGVLQASTTATTLNLAGKYISIDVKDKDGVSDATHGGGIYVEGDILIGSESSDTLNGSTLSDRIEGGAGDDNLVGGDGNDIIRGGVGVDTMDGGAGDDRFVVVGDISGGGKIDSAEDTDALGFPLTNLNGKDLNEDENGAAEIIRGGDGDDTLYVYGTADLSHYDITGIEHIEIRSDVSITAEQLRHILSLTGDGHSTIRILTPNSDSTTTELDISPIAISGLGHIYVDTNVTLLTPSISNLGGATLLSGNGTIHCGDGSLDLSGVTRTTSLHLTNSDGSLALGGNLTEEIIAYSHTGSTTGTANNDVISGGAYNDTVIGLLGADIINGGAGNDILYGDEDRIGAFSLQDTQTPIGSNILSNGLGGDAGFGENVLHINDDDSTGAIDIRSVFGEEGVNFFGREFTTLYVNNNGNITFAGPSGTYTPGVINGGVSNPIIAAFWADIDTRGADNVTPTPGGNSKGTNNVYYDLDTENKIFTVTWDDVGYFNSRTDKLNAFQLELKDTGNGDFDISYRYEDVNWTTGDYSGGSGGLGGTVARAGYSSGTPNGYYELPESGNQSAMLALDTTGEHKFSVKNGLTLDDSNNDDITGGAGDDIIVGGDGDTDIAMYYGRLDEYTITSHGQAILVKDNVAGRDGTDTIFSSTEILHFSDQEVLTAPYFDTVMTSQDIFNGADSLSVTATATDGYHVLRNDEYIGGGEYKLFFALSSASYMHNIEGLGTLLGSSTDSNSQEKYFYDYLKDNSGLTFLSPNELDIPTAKTGGDYNYNFSNGYYVATKEIGIEASSVATVARSSDALFLTFRGTNGLLTTDWLDNISGGSEYSMTAHYARYQALFDEIDEYLALNPDITTVYVSGHSLGGEMAAMYMMDHPNKTIDTPEGTRTLNYEAITFEAANKPILGDYDPRYVNFEMRGDPVPDLGLGNNYGKSVYLEYEDMGWLDMTSEILFSHLMGNIAKQFDKAAVSLDNPSELSENQRLYIDDNNDGVITTGTGFIDFESVIEQNATSYNLDTNWTDSTHGTLIVNPWINDVISTESFDLTQPNIYAVAVNTFSSLLGVPTERLININANGSDHGAILIGNNAISVIVGSAFNDVLVGSGGVDKLFAGNGNDFLYGSDYEDIKDEPYFMPLLDSYNLSSAGKTALSNEADSALDNVSYMRGGYGQDTMKGSGDNDYFFIDVNMADNLNNVDKIYDFKIPSWIGTVLSTQEDYLVFSADQLGLSGLTESNFHLKHVNNISTFSYADDDIALPTFLVDDTFNRLYFDSDGKIDTGDQFLIADFNNDISGLYKDQFTFVYDSNLGVWAV